MRLELEALREGPWSPATTMALTGVEREWVCLMRSRTPQMVDQMLGLMRSEQRARRALLDLQAALATIPVEPVLA